MTVTPQQMMIVALFFSVMARFSRAIHEDLFWGKSIGVDGPIKSGHDAGDVTLSFFVAIP